MVKAKQVKSCDLDGRVAAQLLELLNPNNVKFHNRAFGEWVVTDTEPSQLTYPEGWYYKNGYFLNKGQSTNGFFKEIVMMTSKGDFWGDKAKYSTLCD